MSQTNYNHYSDLAKYTVFDPTNTDWPTTIKDVQAALSSIASWARKDKGLPEASTTIKGIMRLGTQSEVDSGTLNNVAVTPATLKSTVTRPNATTAVFGLTRFATNAEAASLSAGDRSITAQSLGYVFNNVTASVSRSGTVKLTTPAQAQAGTDETTAVTPKRVVEMIGKFTTAAPTYNPATETVLGLVKLATSAQVAQGTLHDGFAVSPKTFMATKSTTSSYGIIKLSTAEESSAGQRDDVAVSPKSLQSVRSSPWTYGLTKLATSPTGDQSLAAAATNTVFTSRTINGKNLGNDIWIGAGDVDSYSKGEADSRFMPSNRMVGNITRIGGDQYVPPGNWSSYRSPWEGTSTCSLTVMCKFDKSEYDVGNNYPRWKFEVRVNGQNWGGIQTLNIYSWSPKKIYVQVEAYATCMLTIPNIPPNVDIQIVPVENYNCSYYSTHAIFCTN